MSNHNPFTPTFGRVPPYMAGRDSIIAQMREAFRGNGNDPALSTIFVGARGTGKTALLSLLSQEAREAGWIAVSVTALTGMLEDVIQRINEAAAHLIEAPSRRSLTGVTTPMGGLTLSEPERNDLNWRTRMNRIFDQLAITDTGLLITVDEVDPKLDELVHLVADYQHFTNEGKKVSLLMAGLPYNISSLLSGRSSSFLRRAFRYDLGTIDDFEIEEAFCRTIESVGRSINDEGVEAAVKGIQGFPYMLQLVGYRSWNASGSSKLIDKHDVEKGISIAQREITERILEATYRELSKNDREFLVAMLVDDDLTEQSDLADRLGKRSSHISTYKRRLLEAGVIEEPYSGTLKFAIPGFREFVRERVNAK